MMKRSSVIGNDGNQVILTKSTSDDLYVALRPLLLWGKLSCIVPVQGLWQPESSSLSFSWKTGSSIAASILCGLLGFCTLVNCIVAFKTESQTPSDLAWSAHLAVYYGIGCFMFCICLRNARNFVSVMKRWRSLRLHFNGDDPLLYRDINIIAGCIFTSCVLEHAYAHLKFFPIVDNAERRLLNRKELLARLENASALEVYYWRSHPFVGDVIPYSPGIAILFFICSKFCIIAWNFGDVLVACLSRALHGKFKAFCQKAKSQLIDADHKMLNDEKSWTMFVRDHESLTEMVEEVDDLVSPIIFALYGVNIYYFCIQLNLGLTPSANSTAIASIYAVWSFLHLITRILVVSISASNVHAQSQNVAKILRKCPLQFYTPEVERAERIIRTSNVGLTGLGCFVVTRHFILQMVNVVFTFEIVLLQTSGTPLANSTIHTGF